MPFQLVSLCEIIAFNMAGLSGTLRHVAFYRNHAVKFYYEEGAERPWRFLFEDGLADSTDPKTVLAWDDPSEIDLLSAKAAALAIARKRYGGWAEENWDDWIDVSGDHV